jgi:hypothetical protein
MIQALTRFRPLTCRNARPTMYPCSGPRSVGMVLGMAKPRGRATWGHMRYQERLTEMS